MYICLFINVQNIYYSLLISNVIFSHTDPDYDISSIGDNSSQLDSNFFLNEDSVCSMDIDISVIEKV